MSVSPEAADNAINNVLAKVQSLVDESRELEALVEKVLQWTELPEEVSQDEIVAFVVALNRDPQMAADLPDSMAESLEKYIHDLQSKDIEAAQAIMQSVGEKAEIQSVEKGGLRLEVGIEKPKGDGKEWVLVVVPVVVDEDYKAVQVEKLDFDLHLSAYVAPFEGDDLSSKFNAVSSTEGGPGAALVVSYDPEADGQKVLRVSGHIQKGGQFAQPIDMSIPFTVGEPPAPELPEPTPEGPGCPFGPGRNGGPSV